jgi:hypothetical protein
MFRLTKIKVAGAIAAGAVALGAAGAYAANSGSTTLTSGFAGFTFGKTASQPGINLVALNGASTTIAPLSTWTNPGDCVSYFATKQNDYALQPSNFNSTQTSLTLSKNYHGKLMAAMASWCQQFNTKSTSDASDGSGTDTGSGGPAAAALAHRHSRP